MTDVLIRKDGRAGHITLNRPKALNALTWDMCLQIEAAITDWASDDGVALIIIDAEGEKAFCAGGDIAEMYRTGTEGDFDYGRRFWTDEYRLNAKLARYPKPVVSFLQGFTMGGGVGLGCHCSHRVVGDTSQIAMPEVGIGLVPDVGGSLILAHAPGQLGDYLALTAARMDAGNAIYAGFADHYVPEDQWNALKITMAETGQLPGFEHPAPNASFAAHDAELKHYFSGATPADIARALAVSDDDFAASALKAIKRHSPLAMACGLSIIRRLRSTDDITRALELEYRFTSRAMEHGDFIEGIRAAIIDKDRSPNWRHTLDKVPAVDVSAMLHPLGADILNLEDPA
ncbi:enoyl-CoA hydratase/isomerase family protein [Shimia ponticola]|uniref:enoyl-CoA hydratase/isomerase family protein n=1 Tax=Shimia ponticola TaxID=2582893 RepID=UPI0011BDE6C8|nr:enoyl-CoA hydratase/isomerase family protein [Shimia ponticola]